MEEKIQKEFEELQNLEKEGLLNETQKARLEELKIEVEKTTKEEKSKELQSALAQKEHFRSKAEKLEAEKKALEEKLKGTGQVLPTDPLEVVKLGKALADYSEEEVDFIIRNAIDKTPEGIIKSSKDEWVQTAIQARREKVEKEKQQLPPSTRTTPSKVPIEQTPPEKLRELTPEQREEYYKKVGIRKR